MRDEAIERSHQVDELYPIFHGRTKEDFTVNQAIEPLLETLAFVTQLPQPAPLSSIDTRFSIMPSTSHHFEHKKVFQGRLCWNLLGHPLAIIQAAFASPDVLQTLQVGNARNSYPVHKQYHCPIVSKARDHRRGIHTGRQIGRLLLSCISLLFPADLADLKGRFSQNRLQLLGFIIERQCATFASGDAFIGRDIIYRRRVSSVIDLINSILAISDEQLLRLVISPLALNLHPPTSPGVLVVRPSMQLGTVALPIVIPECTPEPEDHDMTEAPCILHYHIAQQPRTPSQASQSTEPSPSTAATTPPQRFTPLGGSFPGPVFRPQIEVSETIDKEEMMREAPSNVISQELEMADAPAPVRAAISVEASMSNVPVEKVPDQATISVDTGMPDAPVEEAPRPLINPPPSNSTIRSLPPLSIVLQFPPPKESDTSPAEPVQIAAANPKLVELIRKCNERYTSEAKFRHYEIYEHHHKDVIKYLVDKFRSENAAEKHLLFCLHSRTICNWIYVANSVIARKQASEVEPLQTDIAHVFSESERKKFVCEVFINGNRGNYAVRKNSGFLFLDVEQLKEWAQEFEIGALKWVMEHPMHTHPLLKHRLYDDCLYRVLNKIGTLENVVQRVRDVLAKEGALRVAMQAASQTTSTAGSKRNGKGRTNVFPQIFRSR
jgi:hypothetical protein